MIEKSSPWNSPASSRSKARCQSRACPAGPLSCGLRHHNLHIIEADQSDDRTGRPARRRRDQSGRGCRRRGRSPWAGFSRPSSSSVRRVRLLARPQVHAFPAPRRGSYRTAAPSGRRRDARRRWNRRYSPRNTIRPCPSAISSPPPRRCLPGRREDRVELGGQQAPVDHDDGQPRRRGRGRGRPVGCERHQDQSVDPRVARMCAASRSRSTSSSMLVAMTTTPRPRRSSIARRIGAAEVVAQVLHHDADRRRPVAPPRGSAARLCRSPARRPPRSPVRAGSSVTPAPVDHARHRFQETPASATTSIMVARGRSPRPVAVERSVHGWNAPLVE